MTGETPAGAGALGRRIVVWGATGSGKTTVARRLGDALGLGVVELDAIRHARGWDSTPWDELRERLAEKLDASPQGWVCDGRYRHVMDVYLPRADTVIWLHLPWGISFWRLLKRTLDRARTKEPLYNTDGPTESWRQSFTSRESLLWWSISHHRTNVRNTRERIAGLPDTVRTHELRSAREVEALLRSAGANTDFTRGLTSEGPDSSPFDMAQDMLRSE